MSGDKQAIVGLDWIRFSAAVLVMSGHLGWWIWTADVSDPRTIIHGTGIQFDDWVEFTWFGWIGVQIFFVLSGFVIAYSAESARAGRFLRSRVARLVPCALICAALSSAVLYAYGLHSGAEILSRFVRSALISPFGPWVDDVYWTLGIELAFYTVVWILLLRRRFSADKLALTLVSMSAIYWIIRAAAHFIPMLNVLPNNRVTELLLLNHGQFFALGIFVYGMSLKRLTRLRVSGATAAIAVGIASIAATPARAPVPVFIWLVAVGAIIASAYFRLRPSNVARKLGLMSYPTYLLHYVVGSGVLALLLRTGLPPSVCIVATMAAVLMLAFGIVTWPEPWLQRLIKGLPAHSTTTPRQAAIIGTDGG